MSKLSKEEIEHIAKLSRLDLTDKEIEKFKNQLSSILEYIKQLEKVDAKNLEPIGNITGLFNISREDKIQQSFSQEEMLKNAPETEDKFVKVKAILE